MFAQPIQQQIQQIQQRVEARKATLIAEMMEEFMKEEKAITSQFDNDPIARRKEVDDQRLNIDRMRAMMNQNIQEEKLEQNEDLAKLRADTSIEKTILSKTIPSAPKIGG
jgi:ribosomal protein L16 Arg81 hydroxylase